ncbi:MAG: hypothetical protein VKO00_04130 [Cyanobacteriota bacterium]|nr:hypothetical protein [Cyanobacteriota bacterium]
MIRLRSTAVVMAVAAACLGGGRSWAAPPPDGAALGPEVSLDTLAQEPPAENPAIAAPEGGGEPTPAAEKPLLWRATLWAGGMVDEPLLEDGVNLDLFLAQGEARDEFLLGAGLQRQLWRSRNGVGSVLLDANLIGHQGVGQQKGRYADPKKNYSNTQTFLEGTLGVAFKVNPFPWLGLSVIEGISGLSDFSNYEDTYRKESALILNYLAFEAEVAFSKKMAAVFRIHHRSGVGGIFAGVTAGSNGYLGGLRLAF